MSGMVNLAIEGLLTERFGHSVWQTIKDRVTPGIDRFLTMEQYPQEVTHALVMDEQMVLRQIGPAIPKLVPCLQVGEPFASCFQVQRPRIQPTYDAVRAMQRAAFLLECLANGVNLKGQMLVDEPHGFEKLRITHADLLSP